VSSESAGSNTCQSVSVSADGSFTYDISVAAPTGQFYISPGAVARDLFAVVLPKSIVATGTINPPSSTMTSSS
jgi:hypothetical protein